MTIILNHTIVPARDKRAAAQFFARIFGLHADPKDGHFAPVRINDTLTLLFDDDEEFESHPSTSAMPSSMPSSAAFARRSLPMAAHRGASTTVGSTTGTEAAASIFATLTAMCSN
jgi:catechol 2,3-dioxygenase-like lactoylglutathione lyase family enzyme